MILYPKGIDAAVSFHNGTDTLHTDTMSRFAGYWNSIFKMNFFFIRVLHLYDTVIEYLNACAEIVDLGNKMAKKPSAYSEEDILAEIEAIEAMAQSMVELVDELASYE